MKYALVDNSGTVKNIIAYDPAEPYGPYTPPDGVTLTQINNWVEIEGNVNDPEPTPVPQP